MIYEINHFKMNHWSHSQKKC